eukprot:SAG31_NODE_13121_length_891_cov_1.251263_2_plen_149_part_01
MQGCPPSGSTPGARDVERERERERDEIERETKERERRNKERERRNKEREIKANRVPRELVEAVATRTRESNTVSGVSWSVAVTDRRPQPYPDELKPKYTAYGGTGQTLGGSPRSRIASDAPRATTEPAAGNGLWFPGMELLLWLWGILR